MDRRQVLKAGLTWPLAFASPAFAREPIFIADMHFHLFLTGSFLGPNSGALKPLARRMADGKATLVAWSLVGDLLWMRPTLRGLQQKGVPKPGEPLAWLQRELGEIKTYIAAQNLKFVRTPADVELALRGDPHVVLSVEGASFADDDMSQIQTAYDLGIRHIQLVHYIRNSIGDFQTERPQHNGLSEFGMKVVEECNRLGILIDLAHCTETAVSQALAVSKTPMVWSHSSVTKGRKPHWSMPALQARQLSVEGARAIAAKGGVVGLWALRSDVGATVGAYADRLSQMADWLGEDHVAFGTDMSALVAPVIANFADLRRVVDYWERRQLSESRIRKLAIENYARVLRQALGARQA
jgi:membrane dipeptidase